MTTTIKTLEQMLTEGERAPQGDWRIQAIVDEECLGYVAWNESTKEALAIDPKLEAFDAFTELHRAKPGLRWIGVIDTHLHADHVSAAAKLAEELHAPLIAHEKCVSRRVHLRVSRETRLPTQAGPIELIPTPGHTADGICVIWGPYLFSGDTFLYADVGRDDLPSGDPEEHFESVQLMMKRARPELILLPGHDSKGGRATSWKKQLELNPSFEQSREDFVREGRAFVAPAPKRFKESLVENFR